MAAVSATCQAAGVTLTIDGQPAKPGDYKPAAINELVLANDNLKITFGKNPARKDPVGDFSATSVQFKGKELAHNLHGVEPRDVDANRTFYLDSGAGRDHLVVDTVRVLKNTPELVHFAVIDNRPLHLEHHFVMLPGENGVHPYVIIKTQPGGGGGGEMRTMYRFDMDILDTAWTVERTGKQPKYAFLQSISERGNVGDETWRLPDGTVYQKYDYCFYYSEAPMWGHYGNGFGAWFINTSNESYAGGPLRQELAVHQDALILNYIGGGHFSGGGTAAGRNGEKIHGPWFLYFNSGASNDEIIADALKVAKAERPKWPYQWVEEPLYPTKRPNVTGQLKISHDRSAAGAYIILGQPANANAGRGGGRGNRGAGGGQGTAETAGTVAGQGGPVADRAAAIYTQAGDYIFYVKADENGKFTLPAVRPGTYTLYAWQTQGPITQSFSKDGIEVNKDTGTVDLGTLEWDAPYHPNLLMQIGKADRMAGEYKFGSVPRTNQHMNNVPENLTFTVGKSKEADDWYYAQKTGTWTVKFNVDKVPGGPNAYLTVAVAGGGANVTAAVNGQAVGTLSYGDDASVRRAANRSGRYARNEYTFPANILKQGENTLELRANGAGIMYDTIVMEAD
jgi:rhamnogalacturonan endolyase